MSPFTPARGRAAKSNASGRFESLASEPLDDGWSTDDPAPRQLKTTLTVEKARTILNKVDSLDIGFDRSINPYRGCEHGCIYCYARPTHAYYGLSPGQDFETKLFYKPEAAALLERELSKAGYVPKRIQLGANTDPYQPVEKDLRVTRAVLQVLQRFRHPVGITTKNALVTRDIDILGPMGRDNLASVALSVTTLDRRLARAMEPRASTPQRRIEALRQLSDAGVQTIISVAPIIPGLTDHELDEILEQARAAGVGIAHYTALRLPLEIKDLFREWLAAERPDRAARVMSLVRQMRGGKDYDAQWGQRMTGAGPIAELISRRWEVACRRTGMNRRHRALDCSQFEVPPRSGDQMALF
jgi:DNA repair photolyase